MIRRRTTIGILVLTIFSFAAVAVVLGAGLQMKWWLLGSGGGPLQGTENNMVSAIGQPVSGQVSNGYTIYGGLYLDPASIGPGGSTVMLPVILNEVSDSVQASTDNGLTDAPTFADGLLYSGVVASARKDDRDSSLIKDWLFSFLSGSGVVMAH